jgi:hypothetical protein
MPSLIGSPQMRTLKILTIAAAATWSLLALLGLALIWSVADRGVPGHPSFSQMAWAFGFPLLIVLCVTAVRVLRQGREAWAVAEGAVSGVALIAILPFLLVLGGGV